MTPLANQRWRLDDTIVSGLYIYERWVESDLHQYKWADYRVAEKRILDAMNATAPNDPNSFWICERGTYYRIDDV